MINLSNNHWVGTFVCVCAVTKLSVSLQIIVSGFDDLGREMRLVVNSHGSKYPMFSATD